MRWNIWSWVLQCGNWSLRWLSARGTHTEQSGGVITVNGYFTNSQGTLNISGTLTASSTAYFYNYSASGKTATFNVLAGGVFNDYSTESNYYSGSTTNVYG